MIREEKPLSIIDACLLMESMDNPFRIGARIPRPPTEEHIKHGITDYNEYHLEHGKEGMLTTFVRDGATEIHHVDWDDASDEKNGEFMSLRAGGNPRYIATMAHVARSLLAQGKHVRIAAKVKDGMFDSYRRLGVILAKRYDMHVTPVKKYSADVPDAEDMKEFTIHKPMVGSPMVTSTHKSYRDAAVSENNYFLPEVVETGIYDYENKE